MFKGTVSLGVAPLVLFISNYSLGMKVPTIITEAKEALDNGQCIVIGLQTTGEVGALLSSLIFLWE